MLAYYFMGDLTTFKMKLFYFFITILFFFGNEVYGQNELTTDFPKYVNTGNPEKDAQTYAAEKEAWIATHTEAYIAMQPGLSEEGKLSLRAQNPIRKEKPMQREANKEKEEVISEEYREKLLWVLEHEEEYRQNTDAEEANETIIKAKKVFNR